MEPYLDILISKLVECFSLLFEDQGILSEEVFSFHSWASWFRADQDGYLAVLKSFLR